ncbi:MAG: sigma 54-interacting transcriptional regulator [Desulfobacteraceae bacterium]|nr:sigma 54-interacting transcriptional regulator [Desulfobacteraceae bacterium]
MNIEKLLNNIPMGILIAADDQTYYLNKTVCDILNLDFTASEDTLLEINNAGQRVNKLLNNEFIHKKNKVYKILRYAQTNYTFCIAIEITSLEFMNQFFLSVDFAEEVLRYLFLNPYEGMNVVDQKGYVRFMSPTHEKFLEIEHGQAIGVHITKIIPNTRLHIVAKTGKAEIGKTQELQGEERIVGRIPIRKNGQTVGAIGKVLFKDIDQLKDIMKKLDYLKQEVQYYKRELRNLRSTQYSLDRIIGNSSPVKHMKEEIKKAAAVDLPVLITGETGSGKELVANTIHILSRRSKKPLVVVNIAAIPAELFESELFGYEPGSFTNASTKGKPGKFEIANGGSIFLDEIGDLPVDTQVKLLRVLEEGSLEKIGAKKLIKSDFRIISASNKNIEYLLEQNLLREDFLYRINALNIFVPPLRERKDDIPLLSKQFIKEFNEKYNFYPPVKGLTEEVIEKFKTFHWPGNIRELKNEIERACSFTDKEYLEPKDFTGPFKNSKKEDEVNIQGNFSRKKIMDDTEKNLILEALRQTDGNKTKAARLLGLSRPMLYKKLKALNLTAK